MNSDRLELNSFIAPGVKEGIMEITKELHDGVIEMERLATAAGNAKVSINTLSTVIQNIRNQKKQDKETTDELTKIQDKLNKITEAYKASLNGEANKLNDVIKAKQRLKEESKKLNEQLGVGAKQTRGWGDALTSFQFKFNFLGNLLSQVGQKIVGTFYQITSQIIDQTKRLDSLRLSYKSIITDSGELYSTYNKLYTMANNYGISIMTLKESYLKFAAAIKGTSLEGEKGMMVFDKVTKSMAVLGASDEKIQRVYLALQQMASKGTIMAEELKNQLGESLPGAFNIMARSVGVSVVELTKMMQKGEVLSKDVLPKFAIELEKTFGANAITRVDTINASFGRLSTAMSNFISDLKFMPSLMKGISDATTYVLNLFHETFGYSLTNEIIDEKNKMKLLGAEVINLAEGTELRSNKLKQLQALYPQYFENLDAEKASNNEIKEAMRGVLEMYDLRIKTQLKQEKVNKLQEIAIDNTRKYEEAIAGINKQYEKIGGDIFDTKSVEERIKFIQDSMLKLGRADRELFATDVNRYNSLKGLIDLYPSLLANQDNELQKLKNIEDYRKLVNKNRNAYRIEPTMSGLTPEEEDDLFTAQNALRLKEMQDQSTKEDDLIKKNRKDAVREMEDWNMKMEKRKIDAMTDGIEKDIALTNYEQKQNNLVLKRGLEDGIILRNWYNEEVKYFEDQKNKQIEQIGAKYADKTIKDYKAYQDEMIKVRKETQDKIDQVEKNKVKNGEINYKEYEKQLEDRYKKEYDLAAASGKKITFSEIEFLKNISIENEIALEKKALTEIKDAEKREQILTEIHRKGNDERNQLDELVLRDKEYVNQQTWQMSSQLINNISALMQQHYSNQLDDLNTSYDDEFKKIEQKKNAYIAAGLSQEIADKMFAKKKTKLEQDKAKEEYKIKKAQFEVDKYTALANIGMSTAQAITQALTLTVGAPVMIAFISALAATETALVLSKKAPAPPSFKKGVKDFEGGHAILHGQEKVTLPSGKEFITPGGIDEPINAILPAHTSVTPADVLRKQLIQNQYIFNRESPQKIIDLSITNSTLKSIKEQGDVKTYLNGKGQLVRVYKGITQTYIN